MKLLFVRHGKAEDANFNRWRDDSLRPLTKKGEKRFAQSVDRIRLIVTDTSRVFTSPYTRALRTAEILCDGTGWDGPVVDERLSGDRGVDDIFEMTVDLNNSGCYAFVGHDPTISHVVGVLIGADGFGVTPLKPGAVALIDTGTLRPGYESGSLVALLQPKMLRR